MRDYPTVDQGGTAAHNDCQMMLPWLINGTVSDTQRQRLDAHLSICQECRAEAAEQTLLRDYMLLEGPVVYAPQGSLQKLLSRMDAGPPEQPPRTAEPAPAFGGSRRWTIAAALLSAITVVATASLLWWQMQSERAAPRYSTLTSEPGQSMRTPAARVVFAPATSVARLSELLHRYRARVVAGPSEAGVYTLTFMPSDNQAATPATAAPRATVEMQALSLVDASIEALRKEPDVLFAEPVLASDGAR